MTAIEIRSEIQKALNEVPENILPEILSYIKQAQHLSPQKIKFNKNLEKILSEDKELLDRLAQ